MRRKGFSPFFSLLIPAFSLPPAPLLFSVQLLRQGNAPLPTFLFRGFGVRLEPRYIFGAKPLDQ